MKSYISTLKEKNFILLWIAQIISQFGDRITQMALIALVYKTAPGSSMKLAKMLSLTIIPIFLIGPIAGAFVDRWDRRRTMVVCDLLRAFLILLVSIFFMHWTVIIPIYIVVFLVFSISCFFIPAKLSIIPDIIKKEHLLTANALNASSGIIAAFIGLAVGGFIVELIGVKNAFFIDAGTYFISAFLIYFMVIKYRTSEDKKKSTDLHHIVDVSKRWSFISSIKEGLKYMTQHPDVKAINGILFFLMSIAGALYSVIIIFVQKTLNSITFDISILSVFLGIGFFVGSMVYAGFGKKFNKYSAMYYCLIVLGILISVFSIIVSNFPNTYVASILVTLMGISVAPIAIATNTLVHEKIPEDMRGRIFSGIGIIMNIALLACMFLSSFIAEKINPAVIITSIGIITVAGSILGRILIRRKPIPQFLASRS